MTTGSPKKVIVRLLRPQADATPLFGYLPQHGLLDRDTGLIAMLGLDGRLLELQPADLLYVAYVRDFNRDDTTDPERLQRCTFLARPRKEGLWVRLNFAARPPLEGLAETGIGLLDQILVDRGLYLAPPDMRSNTQRLFVPRTAITSLELLAVITTPGKVRPQQLNAQQPVRQQRLFAVNDLPRGKND